jgi:DNA-binding NarL/FixJ family response regulator
LLASGKTVTDIGNDLLLSIKTVSTHKANLMHKLSLKNQAELVRYAMRHGLIDP